MKKLLILLLFVPLGLQAQTYGYSNQASQDVTDTVKVPYILQDSIHTVYTFGTGIIKFATGTITIDSVKLAVQAYGEVTSDNYEFYHQVDVTDQGTVTIVYYPQGYPQQVLWKKDSVHRFGYFIR